MLFVDDDELLLRAVLQAMSGDAADVRSCTSLGQARQTLAAWTPEVVVLDVILLDVEAHDLLDELRLRSFAPVVVAISGAWTSAQAFDLAALGVGGYLPKPFSARELREKVDEVLAEPSYPGPAVRFLVGKSSPAKCRSRSA